MSSCYKCGKETPPGVLECERCECGIPPEAVLVRPMMAMIDWEKVQTMEEMRELLQVMFPLFVIVPDTIQFQQIQKFLKKQ